MARQARTTENLKERIADALLELCSEKPFPDISISEITDRADVGRATYYRHFSSKEDVIVFKFKTIFESLPVPDPHKIRPHFDPDFQPPKNRDVVEQYFAAYLRHLEKNRDVLERIYAAKLDYALFLYLYRDNVATLQNAAAIDRYLGGRGILNKGPEIAINPVCDDEEVVSLNRYPLDMLDIDKRKNSFDEVVLGYHKLTAMAEAMRCLHCERR